MQNHALVRAIFFLALAVFFLTFALTMAASWQRTMLFSFAGIDFVWGGALLISAFRKPKH